VEWNKRRWGSRSPPALVAATGSRPTPASHDGLLAAAVAAVEASPASGARARGRTSRPPLPAARERAAAAAVCAARASLVAAERPIAGEVSGFRVLISPANLWCLVDLPLVVICCCARESRERWRCLEKGKEGEAAAAKGMEGWRSFGKVLCL
jgi:hypothetical protein